MNAITEVEVDNLLQQSLERLKAAYAAEPYPSLDERKQRLVLLKKSLLENKQALVEALSDDFGYRSEFDTAMTDVLPTVSHINSPLPRLQKCCKPSKRESGLLLAPSKVTVQYHPLGVVGIISP
ncbi:coniferyl-aldehyde dehydrogenase, partial [Vibrio parahaemolyticus]|nr:coniferyl-aldehyde dehydrogenase [Vibrio parahaemolyticus]